MQHVLFVVAGSAMVAAGVLLLSVVVRGLARKKKLEASLARAEALTRAQERVRARLAGEEQSVAALAASLPELVRELNRADLALDDVPPLILRLAEAVFQPEHALLYLAGRGEDGGAEPVLRLAIHRGYDRIPARLQEISAGRGRIGWIALHKRDMLEEDWGRLSRSEGIEVTDDDRSARLEIAGPLVHHAGNGEQLLGVLCLGSLRVRPRDSLLMFQFVTNLGALALVNARHLDKLRDLADTDALTGLPNKRRFMGNLAGMTLDAGREGRELALLLLEIDGFKAYEDANGHAAGARVLRQTAVALKRSCRRTDRACYYGGERFAVAMPGIGSELAAEVAERIRQEIEQTAFAGEDGRPGEGLAIRGGLACFPANGSSVPELTRSVDRALLASRQAGGQPIARCPDEQASVRE